MDEDEITLERSIEAASFGLIELSQKPEFAELVWKGAQERFDGEHNVLLRDLQAMAANSFGIDLREEMMQALANNGKDELIPYLDGAINGFNYDDNKGYLHIYIPFVEDNEFNKENPLIVMNTDETNPVPGVIIPAAGAYELSTISEEKARGKHIWVVSVNERVDRDGSVTNRKNIRFNPGEKTTGGGYNGALWIEKVRYSSNKEVWPNGGPELSFVTYNPNAGARGVDPFCIVGSRNFTETWQSSTWLCEATLSLKKASGTCNSLPSFGNGGLGIIYYEKDFNKRRDRKERVVPNNSNSEVTIRSTEGPYGTIMLGQDSNLGGAIIVLAGSNKLYGLDVQYGYHHADGKSEGSFTINRGY